MMYTFTMVVKRILPMFLYVFASSFVEAQQLPTPSSSSPVQSSFSEQDLKKFVEVNHEVKAIENTFEDKMIEAIKAENLEVKKFNELLQAQQNNVLKETDASAETLEAFHTAVQKVQPIQQNMSMEITLFVEREMGIELYKSIMYAYQNNPQLRDKIDNIYHY